MGVISALNVRQNVFVDLCNSICCKHLHDDISLASFSSDTQVDDLRCICILVHMSLDLNRFIRVEFVYIDLPRLLELLLELFANWDDFSIFHKLLWELIQELILGHWVQAIQVSQLSKLWVLPHLVVVGLINHVNRLKRHTLRVFLFQIVREVAIENV